MSSTANTSSRGFRETTSISTPPDDSLVAVRLPQHVDYAPNVEIHAESGAGGGLDPPRDPSNRVTRSDTELARRQAGSPGIGLRTARGGTFRTVDDFDDFHVRPGWRPGAEPGVDPAKPDGGHASMPTLSAPCEITVMDFSQDDIEIQELDNDTLIHFLEVSQPKWSKCRWINVNGLSWDVIQALGRHKNLHKLAIEDIMNTRNRTKAEWFPTHAFIVLTLQKLVHWHDSGAESCDEGDDGASWINGHAQDRDRAQRSAVPRIQRLLGRPRRSKAPERRLENGISHRDDTSNGYSRSQPTIPLDAPDQGRIRTLQKYHSLPNDARTEFMERHSALASRDLSVAAEQVSIFITNDNTIISFFELSAENVEKPIGRRLQTPDTILRHSCDASMVGQAIVDAIIDLAIPVTSCYSDVIGDLELDVLTRPNIQHTKALYIIITEIDKMLSFINPITNVINALRDHKTDLTQDAAFKELQNPQKGVVITPMTYTYLGDVLDHCVLITEDLTRLKGSADGMIDLIFNTISVFQNESMKQLTVATIIFLPLSFLTGYFGQNFEPFNELQHGITFFWMIAIPVMIGTIVVLMRDTIWDYCKTFTQRRHIGRLRRIRRGKEKKQT